MVLDNADDQEVFDHRSQGSAGNAEQSSPPLHSYLPQSSNGSILITTRDKRVGERLAFMKKAISVLSFDEHMAKILLQSKLPQDIGWNEEDAANLVNSLDHLPLAITQAAAFIQEYCITIKDYLQMLQANDSGLVHLLDQDSTDLRRDYDASSSIIRTWQVSFDQIQKKKRRAAELLSLMAVLDRQGIPKELLYAEDEQPIEFTVALGTLLAFSLISSNKERTNFEMHRLVQVSTLRWLEMQNEKRLWQEEALRVLAKKFPEGVFNAWETCALYLPHVNAVVDNLTLKTEYVHELDLILRTARYLREQGQHGVAGEMLRQVCLLYEKVWGEEGRQTLQCVYDQAQILDKQGHHEKAEKLHRQTLRLRSKTLGETDQDTLRSLASLADVLRSLGKYKEAEEMLSKALGLTEETLGGDHVDTVENMNNLELIYLNSGQSVKAAELRVQVVNLYKKNLGN